MAALPRAPTSSRDVAAAQTALTEVDELPVMLAGGNTGEDDSDLFRTALERFLPSVSAAERGVPPRAAQKAPHSALPSQKPAALRSTGADALRVLRLNGEDALNALRSVTKVRKSTALTERARRPEVEALPDSYSGPM